DETTILELIDDRDDAAGRYPERIRERALRQALRCRDDVEHPELPWLEPDGAERVVEAATRHEAELAEQEDDVPCGRRFHRPPPRAGAGLVDRHARNRSTEKSLQLEIIMC